MKHLSVVNAVVALVALAVSCAGEPEPPPDGPAIERFEVGADEGRGNLLALQAWVHPLDYANEERLYARLAALLDEAQAQGFVDDDTIAVLPEYVGSWLVALDEDPATYRATTTSDAMTHVVLGAPVEWLAASSTSPAEDSATYATFSTKAAAMAGAYHRVMSRLAAAYGVTLVGGSILLPAPAVVGGEIVVAPGEPLVNASFVYDGEGALQGPPVVKAYPIADEQPFLAEGEPGDIPVFDTPAGKLGVLVCADSWFPAAWRALDEQGAELVAVPAFMTGEWEGEWHGYSGYPEPDDVDASDIGALTEHEAWQKYSLQGRLKGSRARAGIIAPLRGSLWDLHDGGQSQLVDVRRDDEEAPVYDGPQLVSLWL